MVSFARQLGFLRSLNLRERAREQVLHENAARCYRLGVGSPRYPPARAFSIASATPSFGAS